MKIYFCCNLLFIVFSFSTSCGQIKKKAPTDTALKSDTSNILAHKKFKEPDNTAVFTTKFVVIDGKEITEVYHDDEDGAWQFFSSDQYDDLTKVVKIVALGQITKIDSTLFEIADMPVGYFAHRKSKGDKWITEKKK